MKNLYPLIFILSAVLFISCNKKAVAETKNESSETLVDVNTATATDYSLYKIRYDAFWFSWTSEVR